MDETRQYGIFSGEDQVGALACYPDSCDSEVQALTGAGFTLREDGEEAPQANSDSSDELIPLDLDEECTIDKPDACNISTAVAWVRDLAEETGTEAGEVHALLQNGYRDKAQVVEVLSAVRDRLPETATVNGEEMQPRMASEQAIGLVTGAWSIDDEAATAAPTE